MAIVHSKLLHDRGFFFQAPGLALPPDQVFTTVGFGHLVLHSLENRFPLEKILRIMGMESKSIVAIVTIGGMNVRKHLLFRCWV